MPVVSLEVEMVASHIRLAHDATFHSRPRVYGCYFYRVLSDQRIGLGEGRTHFRHFRFEQVFEPLICKKYYRYSIDMYSCIIDLGVKPLQNNMQRITLFPQMFLFCFTNTFTHIIQGWFAGTELPIVCLLQHKLRNFAWCGFSYHI